MNTLELLTRFKAHHGGITDYRAAKLLGIKSQTVSAWKAGGTMSDKTALKVAKALDLDAGEVLIDLHIERSKGDATSHVWRDIGRRLEVAVMPVVVGLLGYAGVLLFSVLSFNRLYIKRTRGIRNSEGIEPVKRLISTQTT